MSNIVQLLERLGRDAGFKQGGSEEMTPAATGLPADVLDAVRAGDQLRLVALLGANTNVCCMILPAKEGEDDQEERDDDEKDSPEDDTEKGIAADRRVAAFAS